MQFYYDPEAQAIRQENKAGYLPLTQKDPDNLSDYIGSPMPTFTISDDGKSSTFTFYQQKPLETLKAERLATLNSVYEAKMSDDFKMLGHTFSCDKDSLFNMLVSLVAVLFNPNYTTDWIAKDSGKVLLSADDIMSLCFAVIEHRKRLMMNNHLNQEAILLCKSLNELNAVVLF